MTTQAVHTTTIAFSDPAMAITLGRAYATQCFPYFARAFNRLIPLPVDGLGTAGMSARGHLLYDPVQVTKWWDDAGGHMGQPGSETTGTLVLAGLVAHECLHFILDHLGRRGPRDPKLWNIAADIMINQMVRGAGLELPPGALFPERFQTADGQPFPEDRSSEEYYDLLVAAGYTAPQPQVGQAAAGNCGSGAGGDPLPGEPDANDPDAGGMDEATAEVYRAQAAQEAQAWAEAAKAQGRGSLPGHLDRWCQTMIKPRVVPWTVRLRKAVSQSLERMLGSGSRSYMRPSRRQTMLGGGQRDPLLPVRQATVHRVWYVVDTSGSMGPDQLRLALGTVDSLICTRKDLQVLVFSCDAAVASRPRGCKNWRDAVKALRGGGGTDFHPIFALYDETPVAQRPAAIYVFTDGDGAAPEKPPAGVDVTWLLNSGWGSPRVPASWGAKVLIEGLAA